MEVGGERERGGCGAVNQARREGTGGFMRVYRPSTRLMRKNSDSSPHNRKKREGGGRRGEERRFGGKQKVSSEKNRGPGEMVVAVGGKWDRGRR